MSSEYRNFSIEVFYCEEDKVWFAKYPDLKGCMNHGDTPEEALKNLISIKDEWLQFIKEAGWDMTKFLKTTKKSGEELWQTDQKRIMFLK